MVRKSNEFQCCCIDKLRCYRVSLDKTDLRVTRYLNDLVELVILSHTPECTRQFKDRIQNAIVELCDH